MFKYVINPKKWDLGDYSLIITNLIIGYYAIFADSNIISLSFIYILQAIVFIPFAFLKILFKKDFLVNTNTDKKFIKLKATLYLFFINGVVLIIVVPWIGLIAGVFGIVKPNLNISNDIFILPLIIALLENTFSFLYYFKNDRAEIRKYYDVASEPLFRMAIVLVMVTCAFPVMIITAISPLLTTIIFVMVKTYLDLYYHKYLFHKCELNNLGK